MHNLPDHLYSVSSTRSLDQIAIQQFNIPAYTLMTRAAEAVFKHLQNSYPLCRHILVCCGAGNNAGDGYIIACLAQQAGLKVDLVSLTDVDNLSGDALTAYQEWKSLGHQSRSFTTELLQLADVVIDAMLGTGLARDIDDDWRQVIESINQSSVPVIAVDVPSGLDANTGAVRGVAVQAASTVTFIALKKGMHTHQAANVCGTIVFDSLGVDARIYDRVQSDAVLLKASQALPHLSPRLPSSHKGLQGHVLVIGGDYGMAGAVRLSAESALKAGAGLVSVVTRAEHVSALVSACPELMVHGLDAQGSRPSKIPEDLLRKVSCIVIGPGMGKSDWAKQLLAQVLQTGTSKVMDADALNLLSSDDGPRDDWVLTPHPGEAAHLLDSVTVDVQSNRFTSVALLQQTYGGVAILKGSGSLVKSQTGLSVCPYGNSGMATAGMGDVLTGVVAAFIAQGMSLSIAAELAVLVHAQAGDMAAGDTPRGLVASDLFAAIRILVNPV